MNPCSKITVHPAFIILSFSGFAYNGFRRFLMKYLVVSDIHGALHGAKTMEDAFAFHKCDWILCLGDILYHGPRNDVPEDYAPKKVIEIMNRNSNHITSVRGNCEAEVDQMVLSFPCMSDSNTLFLDKRRIFITHGHLFSVDQLPPLNRSDMFLSGHTHIPCIKEKEGILICNPGSVSLPKQQHPCTYGILDEKGFEIRTPDHKLYMALYF